VSSVSPPPINGDEAVTELMVSAPVDEMVHATTKD
jgi:hypothetical protein